MVDAVHTAHLHREPVEHFAPVQDAGQEIMTGNPDEFMLGGSYLQAQQSGCPDDEEGKPPVEYDFPHLLHGRLVEPHADNKHGRNDSNDINEPRPPRPERQENDQDVQTADCDPEGNPRIDIEDQAHQESAGNVDCKIGSG